MTTGAFMPGEAVGGFPAEAFGDAHGLIRSKDKEVQLCNMIGCVFRLETVRVGVDSFDLDARVE